MKLMGLAELVRKMGATPISWKSNASRLGKINSPEESLPPIDKIDIELQDGIEINIKDLKLSEEGHFTFQGRHVLIYIKNTKKDKVTLEENPESSPRFHVAQCTTLDDMHKKGRMQRYVATTDISGDFKVEYFEPSTWGAGETGETVSRLKVCKNCLIRLNYHGYRDRHTNEKRSLWNDFSIEEFFKTYESLFKRKPKYTDKTAPKGGYSDDWTLVSKRFRASAGWKCHNCGVDLSKGIYNKLLHVHHINGIEGDNTLRNLRALCILCHKDQIGHSHVYVDRKDKEEIKRLRQQQRLDRHEPTLPF